MNKHGCAPKTEVMRRKNNIFSGFTLIELLVVIAVIGMLMAVLLPALRKARQSAWSVVCRAHLRPVGIALETYNIGSDGWIPGPNTSGIKIAQSGGLPAQVGEDEPAQNVDWISPLLGTELGLPTDTIDKHKAILNTELKCPANKEKYDYVYDDPGSGLNPKDIYYSSYSATLAFHAISRNRSNVPGHYAADPSSYVQDNDFANSAYELDPGYVPKFHMIGSPGLKIFALEGARYYNAGTDEKSFNLMPYQDDGGNYMLHGPVFRLSPDPLDLDEDANGNWTPSESAKRLSYRHNDKINVVFFDGHCETLTPNESLVPKYYFPKGTYLTNSAKYSLQVYGGPVGNVTIK